MDNNCNCANSNRIITQKDLQIFRGTYDEVMREPTIDMKFYLAWDTQQLFVGNKHGFKTPYAGKYKNEINAILEDFKGKFIEEINDTQDETISKKVDSMKDSIVQDISDKLTAELTTIAESAASNVTAGLSDRITENTRKIADTNNSISPLRTEIASLKNSLVDVDNEFSSVKSNISKNSENITALSDRVDNIHFDSGILYKTGEEIANLAEDIDSFVPVFCTETYSKYVIGRIYYKDGNSIKAMAGGGTSSKTKIDAGIRISSSPADSYISMKDNAPVYTFTVSVAHPEALKSMTINGNAISTGDSITKTINRRSAGNTTITVVGTPNEAIDDIEYTANNALKTITVYQQWLFGNEDNLKEFTPSTTRFTADITSGKPVYLYATKSGLAFKSGGFEIPTTMIETRHVIDGSVSGNYYRYATDKISDTSITMDIA